jgi:hypothetical protein
MVTHMGLFINSEMKSDKILNNSAPIKIYAYGINKR